MKLENLSAYRILEQRRIEDLNSESFLLEHKKTGAKIALLSNDDPNKVFYIGFRTPPKDSTGVAHIVEHTVLCGSEKFPVKDPFIELAKGSLNTFLNAMTYPDKTVYPVASCNDKDFQNLMNVYLDAVLHPNIYKEEKIFRQEGWHYEMEDASDELTYNGVVYNEMKGAYSSADDVLDHEIMDSLYPDSIYALESGGDPDVIPELTYEDYLDFHKKYYHPSNAYLYLYGNMDMEEKLDFIDREYLSAYDHLQVESEVGMQEAFDKPVECRRTYPVLESEPVEHATYLTYNTVMGESLDRELYIAIQVLDYALCTAPGAVLKEALIKKGIGEDVYSEYENGIRQPFFSVVAKGAEESQKQEFLDTIREVLTNIVADGFDKQALYAGINHFEFKYREADFGSAPKGLIYGLRMLDSWLYDEHKPFIHVEANETYAKLRAKAEEGYFEGLVEKYLLHNPHCSVLVMVPERGKEARREQELAKKLAAYKAGLSQDEIEKIVADTKALREYQETEDSPEALAVIPVLKREDMTKEAVAYVNELRKCGDVPVLFHDIFTNGIGYVRLMFNLKDVPEKLLPYAGLLKSIIGMIGTGKHSYGELNNEIDIRTGGISIALNTYTNALNLEENTLTLEMKCKVFYDRLPEAFALMEEMLLTSDYEDTGRLKELLFEMRSREQTVMLSSGHVTALTRAMSYFSTAAKVSDMMNGIEHYRLVEHLCKHFDEEKGALAANFKRLAELIFTEKNLMVDYTATQEGYGKLPELVEGLTKKLFQSNAESASDAAGTKGYRPELQKRNEGFKTSSQIQYVCRAGNFREKGLEYTGALKVLKVLLGYDYLWNQIRVKGGAYGCMCAFGKSGDSYFVSYRDPNLQKTIEAYKGAAEYVRGFDADERTLTQYIIGAVSELDAPMTPAGKGLYSLCGYMTNWTYEEVQKERDELLGVTNEEIRRCADYIEALLAEDCLCVVGNEGKILEEKALFGAVENLF